MKTLFYVISALGFLLPYLLKFSFTLFNDESKVFAIYLLSKFNLIYFAILITLFFAGLRYKKLQIAQILFVTGYIGSVLLNYFILAPKKIANFAKENNLTLVKVTELKNYPHFKIIKQEAGWAAIKLTPHLKNTLPFNYKKDRRE